MTSLVILIEVEHQSMKCNICLPSALGNAIVKGKSISSQVAECNVTRDNSKLNYYDYKRKCHFTRECLELKKACPYPNSAHYLCMFSSISRSYLRIWVIRYCTERWNLVSWLKQLRVELLGLTYGSNSEMNGSYMCLRETLWSLIEQACI